MRKASPVGIGRPESSGKPASDTDDVRDRAAEALRRVTWHGQAALTLRLAGKIITIDPYKMRPDALAADIVLITHKHDDHYSPTDILYISKADTVKLASFDAPGFRRVHPGETIRIGAITIITVPAYNQRKTRFHPRSLA